MSNSADLELQAPTHALCTSLTSFTLFPELPLEIRSMIWQSAMSDPWIFSAWVAVQHEGDEDYEDDVYGDFSGGHDIYDHFPKGEHVKEIEAIDKELDVFLDTFENFSKIYQGQAQLERYGFSSSRQRPEIRKTETQLKGEHFRTRVAAKRTGCVRDEEDTYKIPTLLQTCRESRALLQSLGYGLAFSTDTSPGRLWFNFKRDLLHISVMDDWQIGEDGLVNGGSFNFGQTPHEELERVRRLALSGNGMATYSGTLQETVHEAVQMFGHLEELLFIQYDHYTNDGVLPDYHGEVPIVVDLGVEEKWGHFPHWHVPLRSDESWRAAQYILGRGSDKSQDDIANDFEAQMRSHYPVGHELVNAKLPLRKDWLTPKVRFVLLMAQGEETPFRESRLKFRAHIEDTYWKKLRSTHGLAGSSTNTEDLGMPGRDFAWYAAARKALNPDADWPSPFTTELAEALEAADDMDSWTGYEFYYDE